MTWLLDLQGSGIMLKLRALLSKGWAFLTSIPSEVLLLNSRTPWRRALVLHHSQNSPVTPKLKFTGSQALSRNFDSLGLGQGLEISVSNKLPCDSCAADPAFCKRWYCLQSSFFRWLNQEGPERTILLKVTQLTVARIKSNLFFCLFWV